MVNQISLISQKELFSKMGFEYNQKLYSLFRDIHNKKDFQELAEHNRDSNTTITEFCNYFFFYFK